MKSIEDYRRELAQYKNTSKQGMTLALIAFIFFIPSGMIGASNGFFILPFIVMALFMGGGIIASRAGMKTKALSNEFKETYLPQTVEALLPGSTFNIHGGFDEFEIYKSLVLHRQDRYSSEDLLMGEWENVAFKTADVVLKDVRSNGKSTTVVTVFQGRVIRLDFDQPFETDLCLIQQRFVSGWAYPGFERIKTESIDFNDAFSIFTKNDLGAFKILKPDFMERLMELDQKFNDQISISFLSNKLYIALKTNRDTFDLDLNKGIPDNPLEEIQSQIALIKELISFFRNH